MSKVTADMTSGLEAALADASAAAGDEIFGIWEERTPSRSISKPDSRASTT